MGKFSKGNLEKIGESIREVIEVDDILGPMGVDRDYIIIKVDVDTKKPLLARFWYTRRNRRAVWAKVKYERLPEFCFRCEKLGHIEIDCKKEIVMV